MYLRCILNPLFSFFCFLIHHWSLKRVTNERIIGDTFFKPRHRWVVIGDVFCQLASPIMVIGDAFLSTRVSNESLETRKSHRWRKFGDANFFRLQWQFFRVSNEGIWHSEGYCGARPWLEGFSEKGRCGYTGSNNKKPVLGVVRNGRCRSVRPHRRRGAVGARVGGSTTTTKTICSNTLIFF